MKRTCSVLVAGALACSLFVGCSGNRDATTTPSQSQTGTTAPTQATQPATTVPEQTQGVTSAVEALESVWNLFAEEEKFWVVGGSHTNPVENGPGAVALTDTDFLQTSLLVPEAQLGTITEAASMMHAMNGNNFTCGVYKVENVEAFTAAMRTALADHRWLCGMPELLKIVDLGEGYALVAFGIGDAMNPFFQKLATAHPQAKTLVDEPVV